MIAGIPDPWVAAAYLLSISGAAVCVAYGITNWNKGDEPVGPEEIKWAEEEKEEIEAVL